MKKKFLFKILAIVAIVMFASFSIEAQVPQGINYQAVLRNVSGAIMQNQNVTMKFIIHQTVANGTVVYEETHVTVTNNFGLVNLQIGQGSPVAGIFSAIQWGKDSYFLQVQVDIGVGYINLGTTQFITVPYAMVADSVLHGGSNCGLQTLEVDISSAEILTLASVPLTIVPAPGMGKIIILDSFTFYLKAGTVPYLNGQGSELTYSGTYTGFIGGGIMNAYAIQSSTDVVFNVISYPARDITYGINKAIEFTSKMSGMTEFDTGNGTAKIFITYHIVTL